MTIYIKVMNPAIELVVNARGVSPKNISPKGEERII
tara:strand:+ start:85 stop:192 length:108 start_codon:yes stop_codon:yes gene_type:complete